MPYSKLCNYKQASPEILSISAIRNGHVALKTIFKKYSINNKAELMFEKGYIILKPKKQTGKRLDCYWLNTNNRQSNASKMLRSFKRQTGNKSKKRVEINFRRLTIPPTEAFAWSNRGFHSLPRNNHSTFQPFYYLHLFKKSSWNRFAIFLLSSTINTF